MDEVLSWKKHVNYICSKLSKVVGIFKKCYKILDLTNYKQLYYTFAYPYFDYCSIVWGNTYADTLDRLSKIQKKLIRLMTLSDGKAHTHDIFKHLKILAISKVVDMQTNLFMYKYVNNLVPNIYYSFFNYNSNVYS